MKELIVQLEWTAKRCREADELRRATGVELAVNDLKAYLSACAPRTTPPTVAEFEAHAKVHGPWLRVKAFGRWVQAFVRVVDPGKWSNRRDDKVPYLIANVFQCGTGGTVYGHTFEPDDTTPWQFSDADGNAVPPPKMGECNG